MWAGCLLWCQPLGMPASCRRHGAPPVNPDVTPAEVEALAERERALALIPIALTGQDASADQESAPRAGPAERPLTARSTIRTSMVPTIAPMIPPRSNLSSSPMPKR